MLHSYQPVQTECDRNGFHSNTPHAMHHCQHCSIILNQFTVSHHLKYTDFSFLDELLMFQSLNSKIT